MPEEKPLSKDEFEKALADLTSLMANMTPSAFSCSHCGEDTDDEERADSCRCKNWTWDEAFSKFGFDDGENLFNGSDEVASVIEELGYKVSCGNWGNHNYLINGVLKEGTEVNLIETTDDYTMGYSDPRSALPSEVIKRLDECFG